MKSILLTTSALIAFGGAAVAEVSFSGEATLGYNTNSNTAGTDGFYWSSDLSLSMSQELDNGLTAAASVGVSLSDNNMGQNLSSTDYVLSLTSDNAGLYFGDTDTATEAKWDAGVSGLTFDIFGEGAVDADGSGDSAILRGEYSMGGVDAAVSYSVDQDAVSGASELAGLQFAAAATFGSVNVGVAYQSEAALESLTYGVAPGGYAFAGDSTGLAGVTVMGLSVGTTFAGADVALAYISVDDNGVKGSSMGAEVGYTVGDVALGAYYAVNAVDTDANNYTQYGISAGYASGAITVDASYDVDAYNGTTADSWGIEGSYDVGNGLMVFAGIVSSGDQQYVAGTYDLGGGASILASYATDGDDAVMSSDIGDGEYKEGMTLEVNFTF